MTLDDLLVLGLVILLLEDLDEGFLTVPFLDERIAELDLLALERVALRESLFVE
jgi:hypothetical protein